MIQVRIQKQFASFSLEVEFQATSGVTVLFGPSGAGKTLILDCIVGFAKPDSGRILLDDRILFDGGSEVNLRPQLRRCGYVFPDYALFPHMTVRENLLFAAKRQARLERHRRVSEMLAQFHLTELAGRRPHEVSRSEKQRCSVARALTSGPRLLLIDERARGLDVPLRSELYEILRQVRADFKIPILLVTHDLEACFEVGDEMLILRAGRIAQKGNPRKLLEQPASVEVARLLGIPNLFPAEITALDPAQNTSRLRLETGEISGPYFPGRLRGDRVWLCARAEQLRIAPHNGSKPAPNQLPSKLVRTSERLQTVRLEFSGGFSIEVPRAEFDCQRETKEWRVEFPPEALRILKGDA